MKLMKLKKKRKIYDVFYFAGSFSERKIVKFSCSLWTYGEHNVAHSCHAS
jgi:hypothetical protein